MKSDIRKTNLCLRLQLLQLTWFSLFYIEFHENILYIIKLMMEKIQFNIYYYLLFISLIFNNQFNIFYRLGSPHDETKECIPDHPFLMTPFSMGDSGKYDNEFTFSPCSIKSFAKVIRNLDAFVFRKLFYYPMKTWIDLVKKKTLELTAG